MGKRGYWEKMFVKPALKRARAEVERVNILSQNLAIPREGGESRFTFEVQ